MVTLIHLMTNDDDGNIKSLGILCMTMDILVALHLMMGLQE